MCAPRVCAALCGGPECGLGSGLDGPGKNLGLGVGDFLVTLLVILLLVVLLVAAFLVLVVALLGVLARVLGVLGVLGLVLRVLVAFLGRILGVLRRGLLLLLLLLLLGAGLLGLVVLLHGLLFHVTPFRVQCQTSSFDFARELLRQRRDGLVSDT